MASFTRHNTGWSMVSSSIEKRSTLNPWLAGTRINGRRVRHVKRGRKGSGTREVQFTRRATRFSIPVLQDLLLVEKGYLPKYSGLGIEDVERLKKPRPRRTKEI